MPVYVMAYLEWYPRLLWMRIDNMVVIKRGIAAVLLPIPALHDIVCVP